jgi:hypothetical protein
MKSSLLVLIAFMPLLSFGQNLCDSVDIEITTIQRAKVVRGETLWFCGGFSLDYGEHPGLVSIREKKTGMIYNVILNPWMHHDYRVGDDTKIRVKPYQHTCKLVRDLELSCVGRGSLYVLPAR